MFDWVKRLFYGELEKDKVRKWGMDKIKAEEEEAIFKKKCAETPSFSRCVIPNEKYVLSELSDAARVVNSSQQSQKQKEQLKGYNLRNYKKAVLKKTEVKI